MLPLATPRARPDAAALSAGPFYDPVHGMYHLMYQDHLAEPQTQMGPGKGPVPAPPCPRMRPAAWGRTPACRLTGSRAGLGPLGFA